MWSDSDFVGCMITCVLCIGTFMLLYNIVIFVFQKFINYFFKFKRKCCLSSLKTLEITTTEQCRHACLLLKSHCADLNALGFDCEWMTVCGKQRPVALLQLATVHGLCCLFRLNILSEIPNELKNLLFNSDIIKLGISPLNDAKLLKQDYNTQVSSTLDLRYLYPKGGGLASMAASELNVELDKSLWLKCGNWERSKLTDSQKDYAAKDAFVAVEIFKKWLLTKNNLLHLYGTDILGYNHLLNGELKSEISRYLDVHFKPNYIP